jgi:hypothetical protein
MVPVRGLPIVGVLLVGLAVTIATDQLSAIDLVARYQTGAMGQATGP